MATFSVLYFGSHPDLNNDDCWGGDDFATLAEALDVYRNGIIPDVYRACTQFVVLDGPALADLMTRRNPDFQPDRDNGSGAWAREIAQQDKMMGCY